MIQRIRAKFVRRTSFGDDDDLVIARDTKEVQTVYADKGWMKISLPHLKFMERPLVEE